MATLLQYKCPCCGGAIEFDSTLQKMKCPYCDTEFEVEDLRSYQEACETEDQDDLSWESQPEAHWQEDDGMSLYVCQSCGGEIACEATAAATSCPFCGNPVVMTGNLSGDLRPDYVIPFKLDKAAAKAALSRHLKGKRLLPKAFRDEHHIDEIKGIYVPFWLFDADANANVRFRATKVRTWSDSSFNYTETRHYALIRSGLVGFQRVPVDGSAKMPDEMMESIEPFFFEDAVDFETAYLAGYLANRYDVSSQEGMERANQRIRQSTEDCMANTTGGYTAVVPEHSAIRLSNSSVSYALYPVWVLNTTYQGKQFPFVMNGQTGKFAGNLPMDRGAFVRWLIGLSAGCSALFYLLGLLIHNL